MICPKCKQCAEGAYCEDDGEKLVSEAALDQSNVCPDCRKEYEPGVGVCKRCGADLTVLTGKKRDDLRQSLGESLFALTHKGYKKASRPNQDAFAIAIEMVESQPAYIITVADGVSSSYAAEDASQRAVDAACRRLRANAHQLLRRDSIMCAAIEAAQEAVCTIDFEPGIGDPPATTIVAALISREFATIGWVGDSSARLLCSDERESRLLTFDHSWAQQQVASGHMSKDEAARVAVRLHLQNQTKALGKNSRGDKVTPSVVSTLVPEGCSIILCTDGLSKAAASLADYSNVLNALPPHATAQHKAEALLDFALQDHYLPDGQLVRAGHDNITIAVASFGSDF